VNSRKPSAGSFRLARSEDLPLLQEWGRAFIEEVDVVYREDPADTVRDLWGKERLFVWEDGEVVSMAAFSGPTAHGVRINFVYTPKEERGRGYASSTVMRLSERLLASGRKFCFLFTDRKNPTSNRIYERIGYRRVSDWIEMSFVKRSGT
jgi:predicted GNAT family acetyltransferase